jgi:hypothetical protein
MTRTRFVVVKSIRTTEIGTFDEGGFWRVCLVMQYPYDTYETALKVCGALNAADVELKSELDTVPHVGLNVKP